MIAPLCQEPVPEGLSEMGTLQWKDDSCFICRCECEDDKAKGDLGHSSTFQSPSSEKPRNRMAGHVITSEIPDSSPPTSPECFITFYSPWQQDLPLVRVGYGDLREKKLITSSTQS